MDLYNLRQYLEILSSNNVTHTVQALSPMLNTTHTGIYAPCPKYDQLQVALYSIVNPLESFTGFLGEPNNTNGVFYCFDYGISLSKYNKFFYYTVLFKAQNEILIGLKEFFDTFPPRPDGTPAAQLSKAEMAWDFPLDGYSYEECEGVFIALTSRAVPRNKNISIYPFIPDDGEFKTTRHGAINGKATIYFRKEKKDSDGRYKKIKRSSWAGKFYMKKLAETWHIRCEITLTRNTLRHYMGRSVPTDIYPPANRPILLSDFFEFLEFDWNTFWTAFESTKSERRKEHPLACKILGHPRYRLDFAFLSRKMACKLSKFVMSDRLLRRIGQGEFYYNKMALLESSQPRA